MDKPKKNMKAVSAKKLSKRIPLPARVNHAAAIFQSPTAAANFKLPRVGCVRYLNARPLSHTLGDDVVYGHPVDIANQLRDRKLDVANVPIMECLEHPSYQLVDGFGICSRGPVYSVYLSHSIPFHDIKTIAVDDASKTSAALIRVIMRMKKHTVEFLPADAPADAHLRIGDQAMEYRRSHPEEEFLDLGAAWTQLTKLPFVYAVWAMRPKIGNRSIANALREAAQRGMAARAEIAATPEEYHYLTKNVRYELGDEEKRGILCFAQHLLECELIPALPKLNWI